MWVLNKGGKDNMTEEVTMNVKIPKDLRIRINIIAKQKDTTVKAIVTELVRKYVEENENKKQ